MPVVVEARNVIKRFGNILAVDDVSFDVRAGECFGILGPNGAGKTSTIRMIYGFSPVTAGSLKIFGLDISEHPRRIKSKIGVCQQDNNLDPDLTVQQNLEVFASYFDIPKKEAAARAEKLLKFMSLDHRSRSRSEELSGGMMRRLVVARALINHPELLILDEPTTGLDPQSRQQVWSRLEELKADGLTILLTTHYMDEAARLCDRLMIMDHGKILIEGNPRDLVRVHAGHDVIEVADPDQGLRRFVETRNLRVEDLGHRLIIFNDGCDELYHELCSGFHHGGCLLRMATLEDVFLKLTGRDLRD